jgi:hypothetical protein
MFLQDIIKFLNSSLKKVDKIINLFLSDKIL